MIESAVLLAAGRGKRQRPFTDNTPKSLLQANGRATLDYVLTAVLRAGIKRVCIVTNHLEEKILRVRRRRLQVEIECGLRPSK